VSINRVNITGNLTRDPELRSTAGGMAVPGFGGAGKDPPQNPQTGPWGGYPELGERTRFGKPARGPSRPLRKGMKVAIEGKLRYSSWEDKNGGGRRSKIEIIPDEVELLSQNPNVQQQPQQYAPQGYQPQAYAPQQAYQPQPAPQQAPQQWNAQQAYQNPPAAPQPRQQAPAPAPQAYAPQQAPQAPQQAPQQPVQQSMDVYDEDIPF